MFPTHSSLESALVSCFLVVCITIDLGTIIGAQPTASIESLFAAGNKLEESGRNKLALSKDAAEQSFQQFISSKPQESTVIGEIKPNASELEKMLLRTKIANTIQSMQEMDKQQKESASSATSSASSDSHAATGPADCYIEVTRVEKVPGKCHRASSGLPICQSDNYMTISTECS